MAVRWQKLTVAMLSTDQRQHQIFRRTTITISISLAVLLIVCISLLLISKNKSLKSQAAKTATPGPVVISSQAEADKLATAVKSGPLNYEYLATYTSFTANPIYIIYTKEYDNKRLVQLNSEVVNSLTESGKIPASLKSYMIAYFDDQTAARSYFHTINDTSASAKEKIKLKQHYIATYNFSASFNQKYLIKNQTGQVLK